MLVQKKFLMKHSKRQANEAEFANLEKIFISKFSSRSPKEMNTILDNMRSLNPGEKRAATTLTCKTGGKIIVEDKCRDVGKTFKFCCESPSKKGTCQS